MTESLALGLRCRPWSALISLMFAAVLVFAQDGSITVFTSAVKIVPEWTAPNALNLMLSTTPGGPLPIQFIAIPLTASVGLNGTGAVRGSIRIEGELNAANTSSYSNLSGNNTIAFLSCDPSSSDGFITPDKMLSRLMTASLTAIVLYSIEENICLINTDAPLPYTSILSMADSGEAGRVLSYLNGSRSTNHVDAIISGSTGHQASSSGDQSNGSNSTVAMSILYSITGIITLLFLIIIATGAIRAHRYPERYGPRRGDGGPRQSRAKGLARAVLDTIPIVKFGNQQPAKSDPELELSTQAEDARGACESATAPPVAAPDDNGGEGPAAKVASTATGAIESPTRDAEQSPETESPYDLNAHNNGTDNKGEGDNLGCSICTDDFKDGEDVRVLPCSHKFHPNCVDPWLINVSGTCPLCRLDLNPGETLSNEGSTVEQPDSLAPPLGHAEEEGETTHSQHNNRLSRLLDVNRLRQAGVEERIATLRQMRAQSSDLRRENHEPASVDNVQAVRLTARLKEKFRIRTRAQSADE